MVLAHDVASATPGTRQGRDIPILLLHSTVGDRRMWDHQITTLTTAGYRVIRCDLRGYGQSPAPTESYNDAEDVFGLLDHLGEHHIDLIGASGGGLVATEFAARWPDRVRKLVLISTAGAEHTPSPELKAFDTEEEGLLEAGNIQQAVELNIRTWLSPNVPTATRELVVQMQTKAFELQLTMDDVEERTAEIDPSWISAQTLLISGEQDFADFNRIAEYLAAKIPDSAHRHLEWAGHLPTLERPAEMDRIIKDFLN